MIKLILLINMLWAVNNADPNMRENPTEGGVPCIDGCGRPTPSTYLLDVTKDEQSQAESQGAEAKR